VRNLFLGAMCLSLSLGPVGACKRTVKGCVRGDSAAASPADTATTNAGAAPKGAALPNVPEVPLPALASLGKHPRIALGPDRIARLKKLKEQNSPVWARVARTCSDASSKKIQSGYEAWDWTLATLSCALVHQTNGDADAARTALMYFRALFDDKLKVGDGEGGDQAIKHDSGYSIRTRGFLGAVAYDWLHDAPGMTSDLKKRAVDRISAWIEWYGKEGYMRDKPIANYYAGYFGTVAMAGAAMEGDDPRGARLRQQAQRMFVREVTPAFQRLDGGQWPESWQYGAGPAVTMALYAVTEKVTLPWLSQILAYRTHALQPDGVHIYDNGDWSEKPAVAFAAELDAVALVGNDAQARQARALASKATRKKDDPFGWLAALVEDPDSPVKAEDDPRRGNKSYLAVGTGTLFGRTAWSSDAVWISFQSGPHLSDHQHLDQGHFEVTRGSDALLVDPGDYGSGSSFAHNTLLIDDQKEGLPYAPNQVPERVGAKIERFADDGTVLHALGDFTAAYEPPHFKDDGKRTVTRAEREVLFSRAPLGGSVASARLVLYDRVTVTKPGFAVTWAAHTTGKSELAGATARFMAGHSVATISTVVPAGAAGRLVTEPSPAKSETYWTNDAPAKGLNSVRLEVPSPPGATERRFLHVIAIADSGAACGTPVAIRSETADGAALGGEAYVFPRSAVQTAAAPLDYVAPEDASRHLVSGLAPSATYAVTVTRAPGGCRVTLAPGGGPRASSAGVLSLPVVGCALK
jgi:hypothetical protein